jgi:EAL domain-containing protein (putative c-di-GMP-specific phosphodiesterase class I)
MVDSLRLLILVNFFIILKVSLSPRTTEFSLELGSLGISFSLQDFSSTLASFMKSFQNSFGVMKFNMSANKGMKTL